jgi:hypothetical protein
MPLIYYFLLTLVLELPWVYLFFKKELPYAMVVAFLLNLFTWPLLHVLLHYTSININILELGVAATEGLGFWLLLGCRWQKAWGVAILANGFSYGVGVLLNTYIL